jgi:hypothetical protein
VCSPPAPCVEVAWTRDGAALAVVSAEGIVSYIDATHQPSAANDDMHATSNTKTNTSANEGGGGGGGRAAAKQTAARAAAAVVTCATFLDPSAPSAAVCGDERGRLLMTDARWSCPPVQLAAFEGRARAVAALGCHRDAAVGALSTPGCRISHVNRIGCHQLLLVTMLPTEGVPLPAVTRLATWIIPAVID